MHYPNTNELFVKYDPGQQIDTRHVSGEQCHYVRSKEDFQCINVHVIGNDPEQAEQTAPGQEVSYCKTLVAKPTQALAKDL